MRFCTSHLLLTRLVTINWLPQLDSCHARSFVDAIHRCYSTWMYYIFFSASLYLFSLSQTLYSTNIHFVLVLYPHHIYYGMSCDFCNFRANIYVDIQFGSWFMNIDSCRISHLLTIYIRCCWLSFWFEMAGKNDIKSSFLVLVDICCCCCSYFSPSGNDRRNFWAPRTRFNVRFKPRKLPTNFVSAKIYSLLKANIPYQFYIHNSGWAGRFAIENLSIWNKQKWVPMWYLPLNKYIYIYISSHTIKMHFVQDYQITSVI